MGVREIDRSLELRRSTSGVSAGDALVDPVKIGGPV